MTIREELLSEGYTDEYIDKASKMEYQKIVDDFKLIQPWKNVENL